MAGHGEQAAVWQGEYFDGGLTLHCMFPGREGSESPAVAVLFHGELRADWDEPVRQWASGVAERQGLAFDWWRPVYRESER